MTAKLKIQFRLEPGAVYAGRWFVVDSTGFSPFNDYALHTCEEFVHAVEAGRSYQEAMDWMWDKYAGTVVA